MPVSMVVALADPGLATPLVAFSRDPFCTPGMLEQACIANLGPISVNFPKPGRYTVCFSMDYVNYYPQKAAKLVVSPRYVRVSNARTGGVLASRSTVLLSAHGQEHFLLSFAWLLACPAWILRVSADMLPAPSFPSKHPLFLFDYKSIHRSPLPAHEPFCAPLGKNTREKEASSSLTTRKTRSILHTTQGHQRLLVERLAMDARVSAYWIYARLREAMQNHPDPALGPRAQEHGILHIGTAIVCCCDNSNTNHFIRAQQYDVTYDSAHAWAGRYHP